MRTAQYSFVLVAQVLMLCVMFTAGKHIIEPAPVPSVTNNDTSGIPRSPDDPGLTDLRDYLAR